MAQRVRKAVLPVAGLGTRFLPATKAMPKEMLTVVDRPLIQYAVEECLAAGIEEFIFVTGRNKSALEDHFDSAYELEATLQQRGKARAIRSIGVSVIGAVSRLAPRFAIPRRRARCEAWRLISRQTCRLEWQNAKAPLAQELALPMLRRNTHDAKVCASLECHV